MTVSVRRKKMPVCLSKFWMQLIWQRDYLIQRPMPWPHARLELTFPLQVYYILVSIVSISWVPWRSLLVTSAKDFSLCLKPVLFRIVWLVLVLNQMKFICISCRVHLLLVLSCFSEYIGLIWLLWQLQGVKSFITD